MAVPHFHRLRIREVRPETDQAVSVAFEVPADLREAYRFTQGQFLTLRETVGGQDLRRSYSICTAVPDYRDGDELRVAIKRVAGGRFSNWANENLRAGASIEVMTPDGRFHTPLDPARRKRYAGFAGGSGITPMLSLIGTILPSEPDSEFTLIYGNRTVGSILFIEALEALKNRFMQRFSLVHVLSDEGQEFDLLGGLLDEARCTELLRLRLPADALDEVVLCGPQPMMEGAERALLAAGVARERIHIERFGSPADAPGPGTPANPAAPAANPVAVPVHDRAHTAQADESPGAEVLLIADGKERRLRVPFDGPAILDAGLAAGANLPYACKGGVCCTCRARVLEGEVRMVKNFTLEAQEICQGFVLTCQAHPVSARVVISYDER